MAERQRLGVQDALWLEMDKPGNLMVVDSLFWTATPIDWDRYLDATRQRLWDRYPVFRSVVVRGEDGAWYWEEQPDADLAARYDRVVLPEPGGDAELQALIASERTAPLDRSEPLWRAVLVDGFNGGSAVLFRGHHAIADGIRMVQLALSIFDASPDGATVVAVPAGKRSSSPESTGKAPSEPTDEPTAADQSGAVGRRGRRPRVAAARAERRDESRRRCRHRPDLVRVDGRRDGFEGSFVGVLGAGRSARAALLPPRRAGRCRHRPKARPRHAQRQHPVDRHSRGSQEGRLVAAALPRRREGSRSCQRGHRERRAGHLRGPVAARLPAGAAGPSATP